MQAFNIEDQVRPTPVAPPAAVAAFRPAGAAPLTPC